MNKKDVEIQTRVTRQMREELAKHPMHLRDVVYTTARQFAEIAESQRWIEARIGDINAAATEIKAALKDQQRDFYEALGVAKKLQRRTKKKPRKAVKRKKK